VALYAFLTVCFTQFYGLRVLVFVKNGVEHTGIKKILADGRYGREESAAEPVQGRHTEDVLYEVHQDVLQEESTQRCAGGRRVRTGVLQGAELHRGVLQGGEYTKMC
jgi:hypothetical protein